jgi:hypothetical protein
MNTNQQTYAMPLPKCVPDTDRQDAPNTGYLITTANFDAYGDPIHDEEASHYVARSWARSLGLPWRPHCLQEEQHPCLPDKHGHISA